jgi:CHAP domain
MIAEKIITTASKFIGEKEIKDNSGFINPEFQKAMEAIGWEKGEPWCASFAKLVWLKSYKGNTARLLELNFNFSKSAVETYRNFDKSDWKTQNPDGTPIKIPQEGALAVWRMGRSSAGHIGIVAKVVSQTEFETIEGNTDSMGGREGIEVAYKRRFVTRQYSLNSLNLLGFILPKPIANNIDSGE